LENASAKLLIQLTNRFFKSQKSRFYFICIMRELTIFANVLNKKNTKDYPFASLCYEKMFHTATLHCKRCLPFLLFTSLQSYFLNYVFVSPLAQESCQAGCLHSAQFTYLPTSLYSLLYNAKSTRVVCQITLPSLFFCPFPSSKWHTEAEDIPLCK